jgi:NarL family two-component system response regulator LiaR
MKPDTIRVVIADDHQMIRDGIMFNLSSVEGIAIVAQAASGAEAVELAGTLLPDVVIMDMKMPGMSGVEATRLVRQKHPEIRVIVLTSFCEPAMIRQILEAGALSILLKDAGRSELVRAIRCAMQNQPVLDSMVVRTLVPASQVGYVNVEELTTREMEVLNLIANGQSNEMIADKLCISRNTVRYHVRSILSKFGAENRTEAVSIALRSGLIE